MMEAIWIYGGFVVTLIVIAITAFSLLIIPI